MTPDLTLHQIAPLIGAILEERKTWETMADAFLRRRQSRSRHRPGTCPSG